MELLELLFISFQVPILIFLIRISKGLDSQIKFKKSDSLAAMWLMNLVYVCISLIKHLTLAWFAHEKTAPPSSILLACDISRDIFNGLMTVFILKILIGNSFSNGKMFYSLKINRFVVLQKIDKKTTKYLVYPIFVLLWLLASSISIYDSIKIYFVIAFATLQFLIVIVFSKYFLSLDEDFPSKKHIVRGFQLYASCQLLVIFYHLRNPVIIPQDYINPLGFGMSAFAKTMIAFGLLMLLILKARESEKFTVFSKILKLNLHETRAVLSAAKTKLSFEIIPMLDKNNSLIAYDRQKTMNNSQAILYGLERVNAVQRASQDLFNLAIKYSGHNLTFEHLVIGSNNSKLTNINYVIERVLFFRMTEHTVSKFRVRTEYASNTSIYINQLHFHQIIDNIISNAIDAADILSPNKKCLMFISTRNVKYYDISDKRFSFNLDFLGELKRLNKITKITIEDGGSGIEKSVLSHIFEDGFTTKLRNKSDHGMGMAIIKKYLLTYKAAIHIESPATISKIKRNSEKGTKMTLYFPQPNSIEYADIPENK